MTPLRIAWNSANSKNHLIQYKLFGNVPKIEYFCTRIPFMLRISKDIV